VKGDAAAVTAGRFTVVNRLGLHARAAAKLTQLASRFPCEIFVSNGDQAVNAKSVMGLLLLCGAKGTSLDVRAEGDRADEAIAAIGELIGSRFGEAD
jgi:phosphocarrier protein